MKSSRVTDFEIEIVERQDEYLLVSNEPFIQYDVKEILEYLQQAWNIEQYKVGCGSYISIDKLKIMILNITMVCLFPFKQTIWQKRFITI